MTPQRAKELLPVITAFSEGKEIQSSTTNGRIWVDEADPIFANQNERIWRVKPEPREFWIVGSFAHTSKNEAEGYVPANKEIIHVREVL